MKTNKRSEKLENFKNNLMKNIQESKAEFFEAGYYIDHNILSNQIDKL